VEPRESPSRIGVTKQRERGQKGRLDRRKKLRSTDWRTSTSCHLLSARTYVPILAERDMASA